jgi:hypothetical protein
MSKQPQADDQVAYKSSITGVDDGIYRVALVKAQPPVALTAEMEEAGHAIEDHPDYGWVDPSVGVYLMLISSHGDHFIHGPVPESGTAIANATGGSWSWPA